MEGFEQCIVALEQALSNHHLLAKDGPNLHWSEMDFPDPRDRIPTSQIQQLSHGGRFHILLAVLPVPI